MRIWSRTAAIGAGLYVLAFLCAAIYPWFDHRTFSGLAAVLLALPWIDYFPSSLFLLAILLNALIVYAVLAMISHAVLAVMPVFRRWKRIAGAIIIPDDDQGAAKNAKEGPMSESDRLAEGNTGRPSGDDGLSQKDGR